MTEISNLDKLLLGAQRWDQSIYISFKKAG